MNVWIVTEAAQFLFRVLQTQPVGMASNVLKTLKLFYALLVMESI